MTPPRQREAQCNRSKLFRRSVPQGERDRFAEHAIGPRSAGDSLARVSDAEALICPSCPAAFSKKIQFSIW
jgi:hypothetical protein